MQSWKKFEYRVREFLNKRGYSAERVPMSGASRAIKGDIIAMRGPMKLRIDAKSTRSKLSIKIKRESLEKIVEEAGVDISRACGTGSPPVPREIPLLIFSFYRHRKLYAIVNSKLFPAGAGEKKETWARDTVLMKKEELTRLPTTLKFRGDRESYVIMELGNFLEMLEDKNGCRPSRESPGTL